MFGLLRRKNPYEQAAKTLYGAAGQAARYPVFYKDFGVPDTMDGRFDLLLVHLFLILNRLMDEGHDTRDFSQALFDATFADMDQTLREMGIGDMGVPKHMRRMMTAFNGRMHAYRAALEGGDLAAALERNLYGTLENPAPGVISRMEQYILDNAECLKKQDFEALESGRVEFLIPEPAQRYGT